MNLSIRTEQVDQQLQPTNSSMGNVSNGQHASSICALTAGFRDAQQVELRAAAEPLGFQGSF